MDGIYRLDVLLRLTRQVYEGRSMCFGLFMRGEIMLLGLDVLPEYCRQGLDREIISQYLRREREKGRSIGLLTCLQSKVKMYKKAWI